MNRLARVLLVSLSVFVLASSFVFLTFTKELGFSVVSEPISALLTPVNAFFSKPFQYVSQQKEMLGDLFAAYEENKELKRSLFELGFEEGEKEQLKRENTSLRKSLGIVEEYKGTSFLAANVVIRTPENWQQELIINQGEKNGVKKGMLVVANAGVIGSITHVHSHSSVVKLLSNAENFTKLPVKFSLDKEEVYGILSGFDLATNSFVVGQLNKAVDVPMGTRLVTSDLAGTLPANLAVGKVRESHRVSLDVNRQLLIEPAADFSSLYSVLVVEQ